MTTWLHKTVTKFLTLFFHNHTRSPTLFSTSHSSSIVKISLPSTTLNELERGLPKERFSLFEGRLLYIEDLILTLSGDWFEVDDEVSVILTLGIGFLFSRVQWQYLFSASFKIRLQKQCELVFRNIPVLNGVCWPEAKSIN